MFTRRFLVSSPITFGLLILGIKADRYGRRNQKTKQVLPFVVVIPIKKSAFFFSSDTCPRQQKMPVYRYVTNRRHRVLASQSTGRYNTQEGVWPTKQTVVSGKFEGRRWSMSRVLVWGVKPGPFVMSWFFAGQNRRSFPIRKTRSKNGSCSHVPSETSRHGPSTTLKLGGEDAQIKGQYILHCRVICAL